jgi:hypothetical protein
VATCFSVSMLAKGQMQQIPAYEVCGESKSWQEYTQPMAFYSVHVRYSSLHAYS